MAASISTSAIEAVAGADVGHLVKLYLVPPIVMEPSLSSWMGESVEGGKLGAMRMHSRRPAVHCAAMASAAVHPSMCPPFTMQNLMEWPCRLKLGHIFARGGREAGRATLGDDRDDCMLERGSWGSIGDMEGKVSRSGLVNNSRSYW
jgi:hypothetical protein